MYETNTISFCMYLTTYIKINFIILLLYYTLFYFNFPLSLFLYLSWLSFPFTYNIYTDFLFPRLSIFVILYIYYALYVPNNICMRNI